MRSLKEQITFLVMGSIFFLVVSLILAFYFQTRSTALMAAETKASSDLATAEAIIDLQYPGPWSVNAGNLYKGIFIINNDFKLVDHIQNLTGDSCTIFLNDTRVATTILEKNGQRAIGTHAATEVTDVVLGSKQQYIGEAEVVGKRYQTAYKPIADTNGKVVGMLYVGAPRTFYDTILYGSLRIMGLAGLIITMIIGLFTWFFIQRRVVEPLQDVIRETRQVALDSSGQHLPIQGSNEIGELTQAFNQMLDRMQDITSELGLVSPQALTKRRSDKPGVAQPVVLKQPEDDLQAERVDLPDTEAELPKGLNRVTMKEVHRFILHQDEATIQDVADGVSLSKVTVRRYLDYMEQQGLVVVEQIYGAVGRPLRIYRSSSRN